MNKKFKFEQEALTKQFGKQLRRQRILAGLSQDNVGQAIGVTFQQVQKYENGTNRVSLSCAVLLAKAIGCSLMDLIKLDETGTEIIPPDRNHLEAFKTVAQLNASQLALLKVFLKALDYI